MARCPNCKKPVEWDAPQCPHCHIVYNNHDDWCPQPTQPGEARKIRERFGPLVKADLLDTTTAGYWRVSCTEDGAIRSYGRLGSGCGALVIGLLLIPLLGVVFLMSKIAGVLVVAAACLLFYWERRHGPIYTLLYPDGTLIDRHGARQVTWYLGPPLLFQAEETGRYSKAGPIMRMNICGKNETVTLAHGPSADIETLCAEYSRRMNALMERDWAGVDGVCLD